MRLNPGAVRVNVVNGQTNSSAALLEVTVDVDDRVVREQFPGFDGFERVSAGYRKLDGTWSNDAASYKKSFPEQGKTLDRHVLARYGSDVLQESPAVAGEGVSVALLLRMRNGDEVLAYAQDFAQNFKP